MPTGWDCFEGQNWLLAAGHLKHKLSAYAPTHWSAAPTATQDFSRSQPMRLSQYFLPILRDTPKEAEIISHQLMLRAGMVRQSSAGIYSWLPLGFRVL